jgi:hypothetical protein
MKSALKVRNSNNMRALIIYPWQVEKFFQWLEPDVSSWPLDDVTQALSDAPYEELIALHIVPALSRYDSLRWFEDGRLVGTKNSGSKEIVHNFKDYRFNGLFYSGLYDTEGEPDW